MSKYNVYAEIRGSKFVGTVEAANEEEARERGWELDDCYVSICHQCSNEIDDPEIEELIVEEADS